ncbi:MAG: S8 family serine peptidase [Methanolobus sp.]|nr:S8 family serine peptidase [Methanolobus sp.]
MKKIFTLIAVSVFFLAAVIIVSAAAGQVLNEKTPVIIGFKGSPDAVLVESLGGEIKYQYHAIPAIAASVPGSAIIALKNDPDVEYVELDTEVYIDEMPEVYPDENVPWGVARVEADKVYDTYSGSGVKVAVIDTGIDYLHPDLIANYCGGYDFVNVDTDPMDDKGHGTHVAGTIAAVDDGAGVTGVAPDAAIYALKALDSHGSGFVSDIDAAIDWAIANDMDVICMSLGGSTDFTSMRRICQKAYESDIVIVAAAGNGFGGNVSYPAAYDQVIAVSATSVFDNYASFSNIGAEIELAAPGASIYSTSLGGEYESKSGTSMAAPHVSGVVALLLSADSTLDPAEVREILDSTATDLGDEGKDIYYGNGLVNASAALGYR